MYSQGESFFYTLDDEESEFRVLNNMTYEDNEYIIAESLDGSYYVFIYDEEEEEVKLLDDENEAAEILSDWEEEYGDDGKDTIYDEDDYYDDDDSKAISNLDNIYHRDKNYF